MDPIFQDSEDTYWSATQELTEARSSSISVWVFAVAIALGLVLIGGGIWWLIQQPGQNEQAGYGQSVTNLVGEGNHDSGGVEGFGNTQQSDSINRQGDHEQGNQSQTPGKGGNQNPEQGDSNSNGVLDGSNATNGLGSAHSNGGVPGSNANIVNGQSAGDITHGGSGHSAGNSTGDFAQGQGGTQNTEHNGNEHSQYPYTIVVVHVVGAVQRPGIYQLLSTDRVARAIELAGGFTEEANQASVNLAVLVADSQQIYVATKTEQPGAYQPPSSHGVSPNQNNNPSSSGGSGSSSFPIDINQATQEALQQIPGIGPKTAAAIVLYRSTNGPFSTVEQIQNIDGIGAKKAASIAPYLTVKK